MTTVGTTINAHAIKASPNIEITTGHFNFHSAGTSSITCEYICDKDNTTYCPGGTTLPMQDMPIEIGGSGMLIPKAQ